jgi:cytidylate kinase
MVRIAIDGPAAAGKSTVGQAVAHKLGWLYLDTGAMYRAVTWLVLEQHLDPADEAAVTALARNAEFQFPALEAGDAVNPAILINGCDATAMLRTPPVDARVSVVAAYPGVRRALVTYQRALAREHSVVMVGRDIGTVVLPDADLKVYLTATAAERARRRVEEKRAQGEPVDYNTVLAAIEARDRIDSERADSPLRPAADAYLLDTTGLAIDNVVQRIIARLPGLKGSQ